MKANPVAAFAVAALPGAPGPASSWDEPGVIFFQLLCIGFLVALNGFFVASEFAIVKVRTSQLDALAAEGDRRAVHARQVTAHLDAYLSATQLGITLASLGLGWLGEPFLAQMIEPFFALAGVHSPALVETVSFVLAFTFITVLHIVLGELAPKSLAIRKAVATTMWVCRPLALFYAIFKPAIWLLNGLANWLVRRVFHLEPVPESDLAHSEEELRLILDESARSANISPTSHAIVDNAFDIGRLVAREVMTPRGEVAYLDVNLSFRENLERAKAARHTRFPLCAEHLDRAIGLVHIKDLLAQLDEPKPSVLAIKRELLVVPEMMPLEKLLARFRSRGAHLALVADEFGASAGIVTLQDVIAKVIGPLPDEFGLERQEFRRLNEEEFLVDGTLSLHELEDLAGLKWKDEDVTTVGGYVVRQFGYLPSRGERLHLNGYSITVEQTDGRRMQQLRFRREPDTPTPTDGNV